jgi:hypothetical protein
MIVAVPGWMLTAGLIEQGMSAGEARSQSCSETLSCWCRCASSAMPDAFAWIDVGWAAA